MGRLKYLRFFVPKKAGERARIPWSFANPPVSESRLIETTENLRGSRKIFTIRREASRQISLSFQGLGGGTPPVDLRVRAEREGEPLWLYLFGPDGKRP